MLICIAGRLPPGLLPGMDRNLLAASLQQRHMAAGLPAIQPNLYEMAALTQELDTQVTYCVYMTDFVSLLG